MPKVTVDKDFNKVSEGADNAAFIFNSDDERLAKLQAAAKARAKAPAQVAPAADADDDDGSRERVSRPSGTKAK